MRLTDDVPVILTTVSFMELFMGCEVGHKVSNDNAQRDIWNQHVFLVDFDFYIVLLLPVQYIFLVVAVNTFQAVHRENWGCMIHDSQTHLLFETTTLKTCVVVGMFHPHFDCLKPQRL